MIVELKEKKIKGAILIKLYCIFSYIFIFGLRGFVGYDCFNYYYYFEQVPLFADSSFAYAFNNLPYEFGFNLYVTIIKNFFNEYSFFVFVNSIINIILITVFLNRYSRYYTFSLLVFFVMGGLIFEIDFMRNMKSILLFILSIKYIEKNNAIAYFSLNIVGVLFHSSALLYLPLYFIVNRKFSLKVFWIIFVCGNIIFLLGIPYLKYILVPIGDLIGGRVAFLTQIYFLTGDFTSYGLSIGYLERISTACVITIFYKKLISQNPSNLIFVNCILYYLLIFFYFGEVRLITLRAPYLFFFSYAVLIPQIYYLMKKRIYRQLFIVFIGIYSILKIYGLTSALMYEYDNVIFGIKPIEERSVNRDEVFLFFED